MITPRETMAVFERSAKEAIDAMPRRHGPGRHILGADVHLFEDMGAARVAKNIDVVSRLLAEHTCGPVNVRVSQYQTKGGFGLRCDLIPAGFPAR